MWRFADPVDERSFQLHYGHNACVLLLYGCATGLTVQALRLAKAVLHAVAGGATLVSSSAHTPVQIWARTLMPLAVLMMRWLFGMDAFILYRGAYGTVVHLLFACGVVALYRPQDCSYCGILWHHRLLLVSLSEVSSLAPADWFWFGSMLCWLVAAAVDVADPTVACGHTLICLASALAAKAAQPLLFLQHTITHAGARHWAFVLDIVLPGMLLSWIERRARKAWQLQRQPSARAIQQAPAVAPATMAPCSCCSPSCSSAEAAGRSETGTPAHKTAVAAPSAEPAPADERDASAARSPASRTMVASAASPLSSDSGSPASTPAAIEVASSSADLARHLGSPPSPADLATTTAAAASTQAVANATCPATAAAVQLADIPVWSACAAAAVPGVTAPAVATAVQLEVAAPGGSTAGGEAQHPASIAHEVSTVQSQEQPWRRRQRPSALYRSPFDWQFLSVKFLQAPGTTSSVLHSFEQHLAAAVQAAASNAVLSSVAATVNAATADEMPNGTVQQTPLVVKVAVFPGCYQMLLQLSVPRDQPQQQLELFLQELQQHADLAVQEMLTAWPDMELIGVSLGQLQHQEQQHQQASLSSSHLAPSWTTNTAYASTAASTTERSVPMSSINMATRPAMTGMYLQPVSLPLCSSASTASSSESSAASAAGGVHAGGPALSTEAKLCISQAAFSQLLLHGMSSLRVVVTPQQTEAQWLLDGTWQLQSEQRTMVATEAATDVCFMMQLEGLINQTNEQQKAQLLSVVLLKDLSRDPERPVADTEAVATALTAGFASAETAAAAAEAEKTADSAAKTAETKAQAEEIAETPHSAAIGTDAAADLRQAAAATGTAATVTAQQAASTPPTAAAAAAAEPLHGVLATLPLLVLPLGAAAELQQLFDQLVKDGLTSSAAYQEMLPLLQDFATALCSTTSSNRTSSVNNVQQGVLSTLLKALLRCFAENELQDCSRLLKGLHLSAASAAVSTAADADTASITDQGLLDVPLATPALGPALGISATSIINEQGLSPERAAAAAPVMGTEEAEQCGQAATAEAGVLGLPSTGKDGSSSSDSRAASCCKLDTVSGHAERGRPLLLDESCTSKSAAAKLQSLTDSQLTTAATLQPSTLSIDIRTLLCGFAAPMEAAFRAYKVTRLRRQDFGVLMLSLLALFATWGKLVMLALSRSSTDRVEVLMFVLRAVFSTINAPACLLVWLAVAQPQRFGALQKWRTALLYAVPLVIPCVAAACLAAGGDLAKASWQLGNGFDGRWWPLVIQRHFLHAAIVSAPLVPDTLCYLALQFVVVDPLLYVLCGQPLPDLDGLGVKRTAVLLLLMHLAVAVAAELRLRRSFVRRVVASTAVQD